MILSSHTSLCLSTETTLSSTCDWFKKKKKKEEEVKFVFYMGYFYLCAWDTQTTRSEGCIGRETLFSRGWCFLFLFISWSLFLCLSVCLFLSLSFSLFNLDSGSQKNFFFFRNFFMRQTSVLSDDNFMLFHRRGETNSAMFFTGRYSSCVLGV